MNYLTTKFKKDDVFISFLILVLIIVVALTIFLFFPVKTNTIYTVTFFGNGGTYISGEENQSIEQGNSAIAPVYVKEGYILSWDKSFDNISENLTVTAVWTVKTYSVQFSGGGGLLTDGIEQQMVEHGGAATAPAYTKEGYIFNGWDIVFNNVTENLSVTAMWYTTGLQFTEIEGGYSVSKGTATAESIIIPSSYNGKNVLSISEQGFEDYANLISIQIPDSVTSFGSYAFHNCTQLNSISLSSSLVKIGEYSFFSCAALTSVEIPASVSTIEQGAFGFSGLKSLIIPEGITQLGDSMFNGCSQLVSVTFPNSLTSIGSFTFASCTSLTQISIPPAVKSISGFAFYNCSNLSSVAISESVTSIGEYAFAFCDFASITIPKGIISIGGAAFSICENLSLINVDEQNEHFKSIDGNLFSKDGSTLLQYAIAKTASTFAIPNGVETIKKCAFRNCSSLTTVYMPDSLDYIESHAFSDCDSLLSIVLPEQLTIETNAFFNSNNLTIFTKENSRPEKWNATWNSSIRPVVWGCELDSNEKFIVSINKIESNIYNPNNNILNNPNRNGHTFDGWYLASDFSGIKYDNIADAPDGTLYAKWI